MSYKKHILITLSTAIGFMALCAAFNWLVNPYYLFEDKGVANKKTAITTKQRTYKAYQVIDSGIHTLIAGNSRAEMGFPTNHPCLDKPVFNIAMPGINLNTQAHYIRHALAANNIKQIIWGVDFTDFLEREPFPPLPSHEHLLVSSKGDESSNYSSYKLKNTLKALFTLGAITDSVSTLIKQKNSSASYRDNTGFNPASGYYNNIITHEGQHILFQQKNSELTKRYQAPAPVYRSTSGHPYKILKSLIELAHSKNIELKLIINPLHLDMMQILANANYTSDILKWTSDITELSNRSEHVQLWSFFDFSKQNTEASPKSKKDRVLTWFWEPAHYKEEYGRSMLNRVLEDRNCKSTENNTFGVRITTDSLGSYLEKLKSGLNKL